MKHASSTPDRPLSPVEKIFWRLTQGKSLNVTSVAAVRGEISREAVMMGLQHIAKLHPLARVRIDESGDVPRFVTAGVADVPLRVVKGSPTGTESILEHEINLPIDTSRGPLVRATWVSLDRSNHLFLMTFHHAVGDGMSGVYLLRDFLEAAAAHLSAKSLPSSQFVEECDSIDVRLPSQTRGLRGAAGLTRLLAQVAWEDARLRPAARPSSETPGDSSDPIFRVLCRVLDREQVLRVTEQSRKNGTTVHGVLSAAICLAIVGDNSLSKAMSIKHRSPVNMRWRLEPPVGEGLGMFASMSFYRARLAADCDFWTLARNVRKSIETQITRDQPALLLQLMPHIYRSIGGDRLPTEQLCEAWQRRTASTSGLTNLGRLGLFPELGPLTVNSVQFAVAPARLAILHARPQRI